MNIYTLPDEYKTGNKKIDALSAQALAKDPRGLTAVQKNIAAMNQLIDDSTGTRRANKYGVSDKSERTWKGIVFASKKEMERWCVLVFAQRAGEIGGLKRQVPFVLQEEFLSTQPGVGWVKPIKYIADFVYQDHKHQRKVVEDAKGMRTDEYQIKRKMFLKKYPLYYFVEV